jgi:hypothetical protein
MVREYIILSSENSEELQLKMNDASRDDFITEKFSYATGAGQFYALMVKND